MSGKLAKHINRGARAAGLNDSQRRRAKSSWSRAPISVKREPGALKACIDAARRWNPGGGKI